MSSECQAKNPALCRFHSKQYIINTVYENLVVQKNQLGDRLHYETFITAVLPTIRNTRNFNEAFEAFRQAETKQGPNGVLGGSHVVPRLVIQEIMRLKTDSESSTDDARNEFFTVAVEESTPVDTVKTPQISIDLKSKALQLNSLQPVEPSAGSDAEKLRNGIFLASSRTYGEVYLEPLIRKIFNFSPSTTREYDALGEDGITKYEIKCAKILVRKKTSRGTNPSLFDTIAIQASADPLARMVSFHDRQTARYDANMQNVKRDHFDHLIYTLLYKEGIEVFQIKKEDIHSDNISNWSGKHGRYDQVEKSGQFAIKCGNISLHEKNYFAGFFSYEELATLAKEL